MPFSPSIVTSFVDRVAIFVYLIERNQGRATKLPNERGVREANALFQSSTTFPTQSIRKKNMAWVGVLQRKKVTDLFCKRDLATLQLVTKDSVGQYACSLWVFGPNS